MIIRKVLAAALLVALGEAEDGDALQPPEYATCGSVLLCDLTHMHTLSSLIVDYLDEDQSILRGSP